VNLLPRVALVSLVFSSVFGWMTVSFQLLLMQLNNALRADTFVVSNLVYISTICGYLLIFVLWAMIYFAVHYFLNYKRAEIENLRWQASMTEIELNKLKSQLNPHFVFNCMNSIRALVDEDPLKAKEAVTQLANILRTTLMMGRNKLVTFEEEMKVVGDYLGLESIRLEERLQVTLAIASESLSWEVPPLMVQTLVENAIKHGIATLTGGGELSITSHVKGNELHILIRNSGQYKGNTDSDTGFGIANTRQRLHLLFESRAQFSICNDSPHTVLTELLIPKT
jgi:two-component system LytT family sensor kinase